MGKARTRGQNKNFKAVIPASESHIIKCGRERTGSTTGSKATERRDAITMENDFPEAPTASDVFWSRIGDWLAVRGAYAPKGVTREFAVVTCWLIRIGAVVLVGAMAYFLMMVIDEGWIGPVQWSVMRLWVKSARHWERWRSTFPSVWGIGCTIRR